MFIMKTDTKHGPCRDDEMKVDMCSKCHGLFEEAYLETVRTSYYGDSKYLCCNCKERDDEK